MAKNVVVKLTDDLNGSDAEETVTFSLDGKAYEIDLNTKNAGALRAALKPYVEAGRPTGQSLKSSRASGSNKATLFSKLDSEEKDRFRKWADLPRARRIADSRVTDWIGAGKP